jgi:hypothetical protein
VQPGDVCGLYPSHSADQETGRHDSSTLNQKQTKHRSPSTHTTFISCIVQSHHLIRFISIQSIKIILRLKCYSYEHTRNHYLAFRSPRIKLVAYCIDRKSRDISVGITLGYGLDDRGSRVRFPEGLGISLFTTASRTALGPTQPPIQWVPGVL